MILMILMGYWICRLHKIHISAKRMLQVLLFQQSYSPSQQDPGPGAAIRGSLKRSCLLLKTLLFFSSFSFRYQRYFYWIYFIMSSSLQSSSAGFGASLKRFSPTPNPGFLMIRSGSSSSYLITFVAISEQTRLQLPIAGTFFFSSMNLRYIQDLKIELTYFYSFRI